MKTVLIADDKPECRELIRTVLQSCSYLILEASDGQEALEQALQARPDFILLDLHMPVLDGFDVIAALRREPGFAHTPVVALTASAMDGDRERAMAAGFTGYISKPIRLSVLRNELARLFGSTPSSSVEDSRAATTSP